MTTGNKTEGSSTPFNGSFIYTDLTNKAWSGTDYPKPRPAGAPPKERTRTLNVWLGPKKGNIELGERLFGVPLHPPRRAMQVEHPYSMSFKYRNIPRALWRGHPVQSWVDVSLLASGVEATPTTFAWDSNDDLKLIGKLREKVAGSSFNLGVFLGEGKEALTMLGDTATKLFKAYSAARKGRIGEAAEWLLKGSRHKVPSRNVGASNWLQLQYGWLPLLNDVHEGAEFLAHHLNVPLRVKIRVRRRREDGHIFQITSPTNYSYPDVSWKVSKEIIAYISEKDVYQLSGLTDPLSIAWELVPYSFVADWFIPIGSWLSARSLSNALTGTFVTSFYRYFDSGAPKCLGTTEVSPPSVLGKVKSRYVLVDRSVSTTLSVPLPSFKPLAKAASWQHAANAVALLTQKIPR